MKRLHLEVDDCDRDPLEDGWKLYSFSSRHVGYKHPGHFFASQSDDEESTETHKDIAEKLKLGLAFVLSYFQHGNCVWSLRDTGPQCEWDNVRTAGILVFEGDQDELNFSRALREESAKSFLETYTCWCNGELYGFIIEYVSHCDHCHQEVIKRDHDAWGFYGTKADLEHMAEQVREYLDGETDVEIVGRAAWLANSYDFTGKKAA